jgi:hypothetical protein
MRAPEITDEERTDEGIPVLAISPDKVCFIVIKARAFDAKVAPDIEEPGDTPADDDPRSVLMDYADDPTYQELQTFLKGLTQEELANVLALMWIGRGDYSKDDWDDIIAEAEETVDARTVDVLIATPLIGDFLEDALAQFDYSCEEFEADHL